MERVSAVRFWTALTVDAKMTPPLHASHDATGDLVTTTSANRRMTGARRTTALMAASNIAGAPLL